MSSPIAPSVTVPEVIFGRRLEEILQDSSRWNFTASFLGRCLGLPDPDTRRGLRKIHNSFEYIFTQLHQTYITAKERRCPQVMAGVVGLMVKMNVDVILRLKLFQRGLLHKVLSLLDYEETRSVALQTLLGFTYYRGRSCDVILTEIAALNGPLSHLIQGHVEDPQVAEIAITIMAHATKSALDASRSHKRLTVDQISLHQAHTVTVSSLRNKDNHRLSFFTHALQLLVLPTDRFPEECRRISSLSSLLVALLRSKDIGTRALSMVAIFNLSSVGTEPDRHEVQLLRIGNALRGTVPQPESFANLPREEFLRSLETSHGSTLYTSSVEFLSAMARAARDCDFYSLGHKLAELFQRSCSAVDGSWKEFEQDAGIQTSSTSPFLLCSDALPECARALREKGSGYDLVSADIIDLKFLLIRNRLTEAVVHATELLERKPRLAFAHYVVSLGNHSDRSLRAAKDGLLCPDVTPFLREHLLWRAIDLAGRKALCDVLLSSNEGDDNSWRRWNGRELLASALEDAETLIAEIATDSPLRMTILGWEIILNFVLRGDQLTVTLEELQPLFQMISMTKELAEYFGYSLKKTELYLAWTLIVELNASSIAEWGELVRSYDSFEGRIGHCEPDVDSALRTWLGGQAAHGDVGSNLLRCSTCNSPSAALKRCKGCGLKWYCDTNCQRTDWSEHRATCGR